MWKYIASIALCESGKIGFMEQLARLIIWSLRNAIECKHEGS